MRIEQITFTRFIAALLIVIFHCGRGLYPFNNKYISFIFQQANLGVSYFFILSGFVMVIAYNNQKNIDFINYLKNRFARIYPIYLLSILLLIIFKLGTNINTLDMFLSLFMLQSWIPGKALIINFPAWSLSVELFFYITFPFLMNIIYTKLKLKSTAIWIILFWLVSQLLFHLVTYGLVKVPNYSINDIYYHPLMHLNEFLIGNIAGLFFVKKLKNHKNNYLIIILIIITLIILLLRFSIGLDFHNGLLAVLFVPLILFISISNDKLTKVFSKKIFVFLGEISFGIYILQIPIWTIFSDYRMDKYFGIDKELNSSMSFFVRLMFLIITSSLSYLLLEKPLRTIIKNYK